MRRIHTIAARQLAHFVAGMPRRGSAPGETPNQSRYSTGTVQGIRTMGADTDTRAGIEVTIAINTEQLRVAAA